VNTDKVKREEECEGEGEELLLWVYVTFPNINEAKAMAKELIDKKLCFCANIGGAHTALYPWNGKIEEAQEVAVIFKTMEAIQPKLQKYILQNHSYDTPVIASGSARSLNPEYTLWAKGHLSH